MVDGTWCDLASCRCTMFFLHPKVLLILFLTTGYSKNHIFKSPYWCNLSRLFLITSVKEQLKYHHSVELLLILGLIRPSLFMKNIWQLCKYSNIVDIFSWMLWTFWWNPFLFMLNGCTAGFLAHPVSMSLCLCHIQCEPKKTWQYISHYNSGKTRRIFIIFALL